VVEHHRMSKTVYRAQEVHHGSHTSLLNDSNGQAGHQGGREPGFLAQIGLSVATLLAATHTKELFVAGRPLKHTLNID